MNQQRLFSNFKNCIPVLFVSWIVSLSSVASAECPAYLHGKYRVLHSIKEVDMCTLTENKPVLIINTASHCGFTSQFKALEAINQKYKEKGLVVIGFASDDFTQESKDEAEAAGICFLNYGVTFTMLAPTHVKGDEANAVFKGLAAQSKAPKWNFNKYVVDKKGVLIKHFGSLVKPDSEDVSKAIEKAL
ncbi:MAG: glutathione peroxidase [Pseudomonadota bacterium]